MSRDSLGRSLQAGRFPRVSGDEPAVIDPRTLLRVFSPRERG